jgi:hypothetical protein
VNTLSDYLGPIYTPLFIFGLNTIFTVLLPVRQAGADVLATVQSPDFNIPFLCALVSLVAATLSHTSNRRLVHEQPNVRWRSGPGVWTAASFCCIVSMYLFATSLTFLEWWLGSYALLCCCNAGWNFCAVKPKVRRPHVTTNVLLAVLLVGCIVTRIMPAKPSYFYVLLFLGILPLKAWQRFLHPRFS